MLRQFNNRREVWPPSNSWSAHTKAQIARLLQTYLAKIGISARDGRILNVGSHGNAYEWREIAYTRSSGLHR
jgi:hypothetical protein